MTTTCDTSVLVAVLVWWHPNHDECTAAARRIDVVPAHVLWETFSVLTRLPGEHRLAPETVSAALEGLPWRVVLLDAAEALSVISRLGSAGIAGGAAYDGLVGATASAHDAELLTRDTRARRAYDALDVRYRVL